MKVPIASCQLPIAVGALGLTLALSGCSSPPLEKTDARLSNLASAGRLAFEQGSLTAAARYYTAALERARVMDNAGEIANAAYNLAACMIETGQYTAALRLLEEAGMESRRAGRDAADIRLLTARTERLTGNSGAATIIADELTARDAKAPLAIRVQAQLLKSELALDAGDITAARAELDQARRIATAADGPLVQAALAGVSGRLAMQANEPARAALDFDRQADLFRRGGQYREMAQALGCAAQAYAESAAPQLAGDRYYRAARSLFAQDDALAALKMIEPALVAAEKAGDQTVMDQTARLFEEIKRSVEQQTAQTDKQTPQTGQ